MDHVDPFSLSLGALIAFTLALLVLTVVLLVLFQRGASFLQRFQSMGAERVNGRVQVRGLFEQVAVREEVNVQNIQIDANQFEKEFKLETEQVSDKKS